MIRRRLVAWMLVFGLGGAQADQPASEPFAGLLAEAGMEFNINSSQQLGYVLFEKLQLPTQKKTGKTKAYSTASATSPFELDTIPRRDATATDVQIEILFCGVCHSDLHTARNEWESIMPTVYPVVPGHEIVGKVTAVGAKVRKYQPGDLVGGKLAVLLHHLWQTAELYEPLHNLDAEHLCAA